MARFFGRVGYGETIETTPGVWADIIIEQSYYGDVVRNTRNLREGENLNPDLSVQNSISIVADEYANHHFFAIRYVEWAGILWTVSSVEVQSPRLLLRLGEVYNGETPPGVTPGPGPSPPIPPPLPPSDPLVIADHEDGTWSGIDESDAYITMIDDTAFRIDNADAVYSDTNTYQISSTNVSEEV